MWESIQQFFRDNPRAWLIGAAAFLALVLSVWGIWGGFSLQFSNFFAAAPGPEVVINSSLPVTHGTTLSVSWSANTATSCTSSGWIDTGGKNEGTAQSAPVNACAASSGSFAIKCCYTDGTCGTTTKSFAIDTTSCPTSPTPTGGASPTPTGGAGFPVDPTGACVFKTNFNAPDGAWFCQSLQCNLAGNPPFDPVSARKPPEGPAVRINVHVMGQSPEQVNPADGPIHIRTKLDSTPKCGNGHECYPPKDPLWTCTAAEGVMYQGRDGHDFYDCYNPIIHRTNYGPITCCANTGLPGDCFTWDLQPGTSIAPEPSGSTTPAPGTPTPTPVYSPLTCAPIQQTVELKQVATITASGGNGTYQWQLSGSGVQQGGTANSVDVSYTVSGQKVVRASSAGQIATCVVTVNGTGGGGGTLSPVSVIKRGINSTTGSGGESSSITVNPNETAQFRVSITNNGSTDLNGLTVLDSVPDGMTYRPGSTTVNGQSVSVDAITAGGLSLDTLPAGGNVNVMWSAVADDTARLAAGPHQSQPRVAVSGSDIAEATADMFVTVYSSGATGGGGTGGTGSGGVGGVATGPGDAVTIALVLAAGLTLLYAGYTRSSAYRRHDADVVSRDQGPMDFRS